MGRLTISILLLQVILVASHGGGHGDDGRKHGDKRGKPNFVFILADDLGYNDIGFRNPDVQTPNLDYLANKGVILTNNYVQAVCTPSRHALMTGRYPYRSAMQNFVINPDQAKCTALEYKFLPQYLKELGYQNHLIGKWNLGYCREECLPTSRGFDSFFGLLDGAGDYWEHTTYGLYDWYLNDELFPEARGNHSQDLELDRLDKIFTEHDNKQPLFLYFAPQNPHTPSQPTDEFLNKYSADDFEDVRRRYLALTSGLDSMVGKVVELLNDNHMMDNTYLIFISDNGADPAEGLNAPFRGGKGSLFEGGTKSSSFIYSPLLKKTEYENDGLMHITDWLPTLVKLAGGHVEDDIDGIDQSSMLRCGEKSRRTKMVYNIDREHHMAPAFVGEIAVRDERFKLIWGMPGVTDGYGDKMDFIYNLQYYKDLVADDKRRKKRGGPYPERTPEQRQFIAKVSFEMRVSDAQLEDGTGYLQLYDLQEDPAESNNLAEDASYQEVLQELTKFARDEYNNHNKAMDPAVGPRYNISEVNPNGYLQPGWCDDLFEPDFPNQ